MTPTLNKSSDGAADSPLLAATKDPAAARRLWAREGRRLIEMVEALTGRQHDAAATLARAAFDEALHSADLAHPPAGVAPMDWFHGCIRRTALLMALGGGTRPRSDRKPPTDARAPAAAPAREPQVPPASPAAPPAAAEESTATRPGYEAALVISSAAPTTAPARGPLARLGLLAGSVTLAAFGLFGVISWYDLWPSAAIEQPPAAHARWDASLGRSAPNRSVDAKAAPSAAAVPVVPAPHAGPDPLPAQLVAEEVPSRHFPPPPPADPPPALSALEPAAGVSGPAQASSLPKAAQRNVVTPMPRPTAAAFAGEPRVTSASKQAHALTVADVRVFIHYPANRSDGRARAARLSSRLEREGFRVMPPRAVPVEIDRGNVRFYSDDARQAAQALLAAIETAGSDARWQLRDFSRFAQKPEEGTLEVWLPSAPPA